MDLIGIENITPYKNQVEFSIYKFDDEINIGDKENFVCDVKVVIMEVEDSLVERLGITTQALAIVENYGEYNSQNDFEDKLNKFIVEEVLIADLNKENIELIYSKK
ncbi:hypothetical protein [Metaclostridioides mangenotii]|uniref:Uncharacterized protein n=1 Tax=Metaclostridioides mangenotii TaxID=1540 RepID=A0ABS4EAI7_9FIRM|nr:hypothetical protein [Clostridioides mangenotii]MBP1854955.1 hypothetical protein [Clostridioides mangenotii]